MQKNMLNKFFTPKLIPLLVSFVIIGCTSKEHFFSLQLTTWKMAPATSAVTPSLNAIAVTDSDDAVKEANYSTVHWQKATVPGTILGNLVDNGVYNYLFEPDNDGKINEYFHNNLSKIPAEDFDHPWWYSTDFSIPAKEAGKRVTLTFKGISYIGEIYVNGTKLSNTNININYEDYLKNGPTLLHPHAEISDITTEGAGSLKGVTDFETYQSQFMGTMRTYNLDITNLVITGRGKNNIKVKVTKPVYRNDLTYYWAIVR